jgi:hypothetical protein
MSFYLNSSLTIRNHTGAVPNSLEWFVDLIEKVVDVRLQYSRLVVVLGSDVVRHKVGVTRTKLDNVKSVDDNERCCSKKTYKVEVLATHLQ